MRSKFSFILSVNNLMIGCSKRREEITLENTFEQKKKQPGLKFNPGLALIGLRKTGPWTIERRSVTSRYQGSSHVCMVPLDLKNPSSQKRTSASSNDGRKYGLPCCSWEQSFTGKSHMSFFSHFFSAIATPRFVEIQKFSTMATCRNDSLNRGKFKPSIAILQLFSGWSQQNYAPRQHRTQDVAYHPQGPKLT